MGLLDVINGMRNGPHGQPVPSQSGKGMSPITMAILALLAYKGIKHLGNRAPAPGTAPPQVPGGNPFNRAAPNEGAMPQGGGLGDLLRGGLGGLLAGGAAGSILSGGLGSLVRQFQQNGQGDVADSWVSQGPNRSISEGDLARSIGADDIQALSQHTGLSRDELLAGLRRELPDAIDQLTPDGHVPSPAEFERM